MDDKLNELLMVAAYERSYMKSYKMQVEHDAIIWDHYRFNWAQHCCDRRGAELLWIDAKAYLLELLQEVKFTELDHILNPASK
jgi:hypothetical protein